MASFGHSAMSLVDPNSRPRGSELARFCIVGVLTAVFFLLCLEAIMLLTEIRPYQASSLSYVLAIFLNYNLHYYFTYRSAGRHLHSVAKYIVMIASGFILNMSVMYFGIESMQMDYLFVQLISITVLAVFNLILASLWVFSVR